MSSANKPQNKQGLLHVEQQSRVSQWLQTATGVQFVAVQQALIDRHLSRLFGMHLMQISALPDKALFNASPVNHCFTLDRPLGNGGPLQANDSIGAATADFEYLPLDQHSVDVVVIHHVLEFSADPHAILREAARVVRPDGQLIVVIFNPWSLLHVQQLFKRLFRRQVWKARPISTHKTTDWLRLLDFSVDGVDHVWHTPIVNNTRLLNAMRKLDGPLARIAGPLGAATIISAKKRNVSLTPIRKRWRKLTPSLGGAIMKPSTNAAMKASDD